MDIKFLKNVPKADVIIDMKENKINIVQIQSFRYDQKTCVHYMNLFLKEVKRREKVKYIVLYVIINNTLYQA